MIRRLRTQQDGFGLIELLIALTVLNVAILAVFATFNAGSLAVQRASRTSTAEVIGDRQLELYRARLWNDIGLASALLPGDGVHTADAASALAQLTVASCTTALPECMPVQTGITGPDNRVYRIDSYVTQLDPGSGAPAGGRTVKQVTVVVRKGDASATELARMSSTFDQATGCTGTSANPC